jgi:transcription elongation factor Elf1
MSKVIPFACPKCGNEVLIARVKIKSVSDFDGTVCKGCGYTVTEEDIRKHALQIVEGMIAKIKR